MRTRERARDRSGSGVTAHTLVAAGARHGAIGVATIGTDIDVVRFGNPDGRHVRVEFDSDEVNAEFHDGEPVPTWVVTSENEDEIAAMIALFLKGADDIDAPWR